MHHIVYIIKCFKILYIKKIYSKNRKQRSRKKNKKTIKKGQSFEKKTKRSNIQLLKGV